MGHDILFALWFFLPAGLANVTPILAAHLPGLRNLNAPLDNNWHLRKKRLFGGHKTWRGVICGVLVGILVVWLQTVCFHNNAWARNISRPVNYDHISVILLGLLLSLGALLGDALKSSFKRQLGIVDGQHWFPFDQLDYIFGGLIAVSFYIRLSFIDYLLIIVLWFCMHLLFSYVGYLLKFKSQPI